MLVALPDGLDPVAAASLSDNVVDGYRCVGPYEGEMADLDQVDRRVLVAGALSVGLYATATAIACGLAVDYVDTDPGRLRIAEALGASAHERPLPDPRWTAYPVSVSTTGDARSLAAVLRCTWPGGVCTDTGIHYQPAVGLPLLEMYTTGVRFVTGRANARADLPAVLGLLDDGLQLAPVTQHVVDWDEAPDVWPDMRVKTVFARPEVLQR